MNVKGKALIQKKMNFPLLMSMQNSIALALAMAKPQGEHNSKHHMALAIARTRHSKRDLSPWLFSLGDGYQL
jgi:hypothetical protein